ncbi:hypothetical protein B5S33_g2096 [[Candida] boidinii]|nr:hypothetical protein B5S33_g2096 [[Candida] boidinii]
MSLHETRIGKPNGNGSVKSNIPLALRNLLKHDPNASKLNKGSVSVRNPLRFKNYTDINQVLSLRKKLLGDNPEDEEDSENDEERTENQTAEIPDSNSDAADDINYQDVEMSVSDSTDKFFMETQQTAKHFINIKGVHVTNNSIEKHLTICLYDLPNFLTKSELNMETFLVYLMNQIKNIPIKDNDGNVISNNINMNFKWSLLSNDYVENKPFYIIFEDTLTLFIFKKVFEYIYSNEWIESDTNIAPASKSVSDASSSSAIKSKFKIVLAPLTTKLIEKLVEKLPSLTQTFESETTKEFLEDFKNNFINFKVKALNNLSTLEDQSKISKLDILAKKYSKENIDPKELIDIPSDMIETVKENIINFRLQVINLEKKNRNEQILNDKKNSRMKLKRLFTDLKEDSKSKSDIKMGNNNGDEGDEDDETEDTTNGGDDITDEEYERLQEVRRNKQIEQAYSMREKEVIKRDQARINEYNNFEKFLKHEVYMNKLIPEKREKFLNNFVNNVKDINNTIDSNISYYKNHKNYLSYRNKVKLEEERLDDLDRDAEAKETNAGQKTSDFISKFDRGKSASTGVKIVLKKQAKKDTESEEDMVVQEQEIEKEEEDNTAEGESGKEEEEIKAQQETQESDSEANVVERNLGAVETKVSAIVTGYLGFEEDSLVEFIIDFIKGKQKKDDSEAFKNFVEELSETLDEDAAKAVDDIYLYIDTLN